MNAKASFSQLFILPCDHRDILRALWDAHHPRGFVQGDQWVTYAKHVVLDGLLMAVQDGVKLSDVALLMDEELGAAVLERARDRKVSRFVPTDDGTVGDYVLQYGADFPKHIEAVDPDYVQTLINYNPESPEAAAQASRIAPLFKWLGTQSRQFMLELQVLPTEQQISSAGGREAWVSKTRPGLIRKAVSELKDQGARPDVWKLEPMPDVQQYERTIEAIRSEGCQNAVAVVLGGGATTEAVDDSLRRCAKVDGFIGFAVGRSVWADGLQRLAKGDCDGPAAAKSIGDNFRHFTHVFSKAKSDA